MTDDDYDSLQAEYDLCGVDGRLRDFAEAVADAEREACARQMERLGAHEMAHCLRNYRGNLGGSVKPNVGGNRT